MLRARLRRPGFETTIPARRTEGSRSRGNSFSCHVGELALSLLSHGLAELPPLTWRELEAMLKRVFIGLVINFVGLVLASGLDASASDASVAFKVIVNPKVAGQRLPRAVLAEIYLGTVERWGDGTMITPVDLSSTSPVRQAFSQQTLGMRVEAVSFHWLRKLDSGKRPPISKSSDEDVIAFVASQRGAVGYVSLATQVPETVREITVQ